MTCRRSLLLATTLAVLVLAVAHSAAEDRGTPSTTGLVVSTSGLASDVGADMLARGGNAVDAAVATAFALAVTYPSAGNIGGGGFMIVRTPDGRATAFDYRERAPRASTRTMYLDAKGEIDRSLTAAGYLAPGVPGTVRGLALAHERFGRLPWKVVVSPAVTLAEQGFVVSDRLAGGLNSLVERARDRFPATIETYGKPGGGEWTAGDRLVLPDLARTLGAIANDGPGVFYTGWIAERIVDDMKANGGLITGADLAAYEAKERTPVRGTFMGYEIISMPPPSSGGVALVEMLNILEQFDLKAHDRFSPWTLHVMIEAMRRAYLDRARHLGDTDFVDVPIDRLTSKAYAKTLAAGIDQAHASSSVELGEDIVTVTDRGEPDETTHFSVVDKDGMAVANTYTLEGGYGSKIVVKGAGFLLNNEMGDFNKKPGETNLRGDIGTPPNLIAPGKRMLSSMTPTILARDGKLALVTGSPGGRTIINTVLGIVLNATVYGMNAREAVDAPRMHHQWLPDSIRLEEGAVPPEVVDALEAMGHEITFRSRQGEANSILIDPTTGVAYGANDRRRAGSKASVPGTSVPKT
jgi:gamma-glutamyltranspeptidase/glutathione hydrolase